MFKLATVFLGLTLALGSAQAQEQQENKSFQLPLGATCNTIEAVETYVKTYGEIPVASSDVIVSTTNGEMLKGIMVVYANPETRSLTTAVEFPEEDISCVLALGENFGPIIGNSDLKNR